MHTPNLDTSAPDRTTQHIIDVDSQLLTTDSTKLTFKMLYDIQVKTLEEVGRIAIFSQNSIPLWSASILTAKMELDIRHLYDYCLFSPDCGPTLKPGWS